MATHTIRVGIAGYGNLGRGVLAALARCPDMRPAGVFTRRDPASLRLPDPATPVLPLDEAAAHRDDIDVMILCGGSKDDLPAQGPELARWFTTVDSYDTHARIPRYFEAVDAAARAHGNLSVIAVGWDPGLFSINRLMGEAILPAGATYTFWGKGLSQGHSDAIRRVPGVRAGVQYTIPVPEAVARVRAGEQPALSTRERHRRECLVALEPGADPREVEQAIVAMPDYFADYDTTVHFIDEATLAREHAGMPHGGFVIRSGQTAAAENQVMEFSLKLDSNPAFTSSVLVAYARAAWRMKSAGETGARTVFDVAPGLLSPRSPEALRKALL
ncbi:Meso-diaminopimelate D-dehydrogenase OS=Castellaniella defragrans (strain DSM / CCUG 39792 /65Phen) OX=1437824 GN=BN940_07121 PE=3 SV=1 [Castellaniella denitrificans]|uniref:diaminopimelate dehydrogenase n=1 Tax=Castellaniella sp. TaxID=1955812 RepID=UPI002AFE5BE9|nr:diaminopimelate dehydrogenase [Castellaniella sp.]